MASASDFLKKRTAARQQAESIQSSDKTPLGKNDDGTVTRASNFLRNKAAERRAVIDQQYGKDAYGGSGRYEADKAQGFNSWLESVNGLSSQLGSDYQSRDGKFQSAADFGKYRDDNDARISVMQNRANAYRTYFQDNREIYGEDAVNGVLSTLDQGSKYLEELRGGLNSEYDFWSQFKDENDYNTYQRGKEYAALAENPDFAEKSQYKSTANGQEKFNAWSGTYSNSGFDDIAYDYINRNEDARSRQMLSDIQSNASLLGLDNSERREMTDDEIATFNYLYAQDTANGDAEHKNAYAYIDYLTGDLNYRQRAKAEEEWAAYAKEHPVGSSAFSVLESPLKGLSYLGQAADYLSDGEIDQNAGYNKFSYINSAIRNEVNTIVEDNWGGVGSFAYQTGMSMGDFLLNTAITGGNQALSLAIMGTGAAADATISAKDRGLSDNQAFALGTIAGAAEIITEKVSLEALLDKTALTKSAMGYFLKNTLAEGSEEVGSDIINLVADVLISKDKSEWQTSIDAYEAEGMTEKEAFWRAVRDQAENMGLDFLGGAVSGGVMSGAGIAINAGLNEYGARRTGAEFQAMGDDVVQATIQEGLASDPSTQSYKLAVQLQQKLDAGQTLTNAEIGRLYQANVQAIDAEDGSGDLLLRAAEEVTQKGRVTNNTAIDILSNPTAINTLTQEAGLNITEDMSKSRQRKAVKSAVETLARAQSDVSVNTRETTPTATETQQTATQETVRPAMQVEQQRPAAQQAYDIRRVRDAAASLGENGAKALSASYDGSVRVDDYYAGFASYYEAGISGIDMDKVQSRYATQLNQAQRFAAYSAGQNDAAASLALEREGVKSATVYGDEAGFVQSEHSASLPKETVRFYNSLARAAGVKIQMAEATGKGGANGWYSNGIIHIANDAENPGTVVAKHEITHRMQEMAPEAYRKYRDYAMSALAEWDGSTASIVEQYKSRYAEAGVNLSTEQAMDEIAADFTEALTVDPARFETLAKENRSVARKLLDAVRDFVRKVKSLFKGDKTAQNQAAASAYGVSIDTLEEAARLWEEALKATSEQTANKNAAQTDGGTKFSIKRTSQMTLAQQLKMFYDGKMASSDAFYFGETPAVLEKSGFDALPLAMTIGDFRKSTQKKHNIPRRVLKNLMSNLASPLFSFGSGDRAGIVLNDIDGDGYTLLAALERGTDMDRKPVNVINSLYGLEHPAEWIKNQIDSGNEFVLYDEKRANAFLQTYGYMASVGDGIRSMGESVTQNGAEVKTKFSLKEDSQGRELTEAQREYFRDSKVLDSDGQLKVMYRGGNGDFTVFDRKKSSYSNLYGRGFYFTDSEAHAKQYGNAKAFYLNITAPVSTTETTITRDQMRKFLKAVAANEDDFSFENYGYDATVSSVLKSVYGKSDFAMLYDVNQTAIGDMVAAVELFNKVNGTNYDGLILDTETVAFQSNQIKSVTNQNPTSDPDIRYSLKEYTDEEKKQHVKDAAAYFGRTYKWAETGYITTDGRRLDFSGRHDGGPGGYRTVDHRDIRDALGLDYGGDDYSGSMVQFMAEGNIRISPESGGINLSVMPTKAQLDTLSDFISKQRGEVILDLDAPGGDTISSTEYPRGTHANKVLADIKAYFEEGKQPYVSEVSRFRYSLKGRDILQENAALQEENRLLREQMKDYIALQRRNGTLQESRDYWRGQTRRTQRVTTDKKAVTAAAKQLIQNYGADIAVKDIQGDLQSLYDYIASGYDGKDELTYTEARHRAEDIAQTLVSNAVAVDSDMYDAYSDLRDYLRTTKIIYGKEYHGDIADYGDFRKRQFGRLNLGSEGHTNIDQVYQELSSRWPEFFSEQEQTHPTDQLLHIVEVLDGISEINEYNPFSRYMDQAVTGAANEIMETFFDLPQTRKTFADRQALKLENAKAKGREQVQKVREQYTTRLAELREQNRQRVQNAIAKERETRERQMGALKDRYAAKDAAGRERRAARELRAKITRHASALSQKLLRPSDQHHIPEAMRGPVAAMLESINQESQYTLDENGKRVKNGDGTPTKRTEAFRALKEQYAKIVAEGGDMVIDPSLLGSDADGIKGGFDAVIAMKDTKLADMSVAQLKTVWQVVKAVEHSVNTAGKILSKAKYARTADWAQAISIGTSSRRAKSSLTRNHALIDLETPYTFFSHYGEAGKAAYRMLRDAQDQQQLMVDHVAEEVRKIVDPKTVKKLETTTQTFITERGEKLTLSTAQAMELYELVKRKQAHDHLLKGGVVQPEIKTSQIRRGTDSIRLTEGDLVNITGTLTPEQVKIADGLQGLTTGVLADYGNKASMEAYGYKKFTESDYWPIKSAKEGLHSNIEKGGNNTRSIKNIGMAKTTMPHASNALDLAGIFTTFANHASDMTDYASWLCTMEDINRLFNYQFRDEEGNPTGKTIKGLLDRVGGPGSQKYWHNLMEDIQNGINAPGDSPMWDIAGKTIGSFKGAAVGANIRVVIQQPTAFFRAAAVLDPQDMARGLARGVTRGNGWKKALQYSPIAMRKDAGGFDISSPYQMTETLFDNRTNVRKLNDVLSAPAGAADAVTWGKLWNACEWATAREHQGLTKGSEAFYQQTAKLFAEVIDQTQVVDGVLQRSNIMRSSNAVVKQATSFMGEPIMSLNLLMRTYDQVRYEQNSQKRGKAIKTMGRAATALVVTNVVNALAQSLIDAMRDDDADKKYWERFRAAFTGISGDEETPWEKAWNAIMEGNVGSNMNPLGQIPFVKDALSIMQGYDVSRTEMEIVSDLIQAGQTAIQSADGQGKRTRAYALKGLLAAGAKMFGIPASNLTRDMWGLARSAAVETGNIPLQYEMEKAIYNISNTGNKNRYYTILYGALEQGDMDTYQHIRDDLMNSMGVDGASIDSAMRSRYNKAVEKDPDYTLPQRARDLIGSRDQYAPAKEKEETFGADDLGSSAYQAYSDQRANDYRSMADDLANNPIFLGMDDETRDKVLKAAYDLADKSALADHSDGQYEVSTKWMAQADDAEAQGIEPWEYVLFHTAYNEMEGTKDADGKTVKGEAKSDHVREWLEDFSGLTDEQRAFLWGTVYTSEW
mgnify:CR=1 FL=1